VSGTLPEGLVRDMKQSNIPYRCRDLQHVGKGYDQVPLGRYEKKSRRKYKRRSTSSTGTEQQDLTSEEAVSHTQDEAESVMDEEEDGNGMDHEDNEQTNGALDESDESSNPCTEDGGFEDDQVSEAGPIQSTEQDENEHQDVDDKDSPVYKADHDHPYSYARPILEDGSDSDCEDSTIFTLDN